LPTRREALFELKADYNTVRPDRSLGNLPINRCAQSATRDV
jgi:hypothetical protein